MTRTEAETIDAAAARFRAELAANAAIGSAEADELEDHLRAIIAAELASGVAAPVAIGTARGRLGAPAALAAECTRVRTAFGARLGPTRAWAAAAIFAVTWVYAAWMWLPRLGIVSHVGAELGLGLVLLPGLVIGRTWPRAILFGTAVVLAATATTWLVIWDHRPGTADALLVAGYAAAAVLLAPMSMREIAPAGWSLVAWSIAYFGATNAGLLAYNPEFRVAVPGLSLTVGELLPIAVLAGIWLAALGTVLRARWGVVIGLCTAAMLVVTLIGIATVHSTRTMTINAPYQEFVIVMTAIACIAAIAAPLLAWRDTRRGFGEPRALLVA